MTMIEVVEDEHELVQEKIKSLLINEDLRHDERNLVVLTLLTRSNFAQIDAMAMVSTKLFNFCIRLVRMNHPSFTRLASRCVSLLKRKRVDTDGCAYAYNWEEMVQTLLTAIEHRSHLHLPIDTTDAHLIHALAHSLETDNSVSWNSHQFDMIWERLRRVVAYPADNENDNEETTASDDVGAHTRFMDQTIDRLLQDDTDDETQDNAWMHSFIHLWHTNASRLCRAYTSPPAWYEAMLLFVVSKDSNLNTQTKTAWHDLIFQSTNSLVIHTSNLNFTNTLVAQALADLLMVHLGSPQSDLQSRAWETCSLLVSRHGWDWIPKSKNSYATQASHLCTWTRLAAGEYRIQLGLVCMEDPKAFDNQTLNASGHVVVSALRRLVQEATTLDDGRQIALDPEALLHLRQSFLDTLQSTISYFAIASSPMVTTCKVLGSLLGEFSIWDGMPDGTTTEEVLLAVNKCICADVVDMMPCLANMFASTEEDSERMQSLRTAGILGDKLEAYYADFWTDAASKHIDFVPWACAATENWFSLASPPMKQRRSLAKHILGWIKKSLEEGITASVANPLLSAVGCYVVLMGDRAPPEQDSVLIELALSKCAKLQDLA
jgi:hypothetical protein